MQFQRNIAYVAVVCFLVAVTARSVANGFQVSPSEINEQVGNLLQDQENAISKENVIGSFAEDVLHPLVFVIMPPKNPTLEDNEFADPSSHLEQLQHQHLEAQADLEDHEQQLLLAQKVSVTTHKSAEEALNQLSSITSALHNSLEVFRYATESSKLATTKLDQQKSQTERASSWLLSVESRLQEVISDYEATKKAAEIAAVSAKEAQLIAYDGGAEAVTH